ncbi:hypothetical protein M9H77_35692 [Catharanthus roseus]|uniref:Uncharacterized protein n=1 Tax=Catharanthus roseus TaxID=4058 RepID=A0ACB9ZPQ8_CATRO|nr:hypothetical protein M9H77_35692 [Catharanthus roseus]
MVRPEAHRGDDDLGLVTDRTGRVQDRVVITSSRGVRGRHNTFDILATPAPLGPGIYYDPSAPGSSTQPSLYGLRPVLLPHHTIHTLPYPMILMDLVSHHISPHLYHMIHMHMLLLCLPQPLNEVSGGPRLQLAAKFFEQLVLGVQADLSYSTGNYAAIDYGHPSSEPCSGRDSGTTFESDRGQSEEPDMVRFVYIGDEDDQDEPVPVAPASSSSVRPAPGKGKGLNDSFMSVMMLIPSYSGHVAGIIWHGQLVVVIQSDLRITYSRGGINSQGLAQVHRVACYIQYLLRSSLFTIRVVTSSLPSYGHL